MHLRRTVTATKDLEVQQEDELMVSATDPDTLDNVRSLIERLRQLDRQAFYAHELPADVIEELGTISVPEQARQFDDEHTPE